MTRSPCTGCMKDIPTENNAIPRSSRRCAKGGVSGGVDDGGGGGGVGVPSGS